MLALAAPAGFLRRATWVPGAYLVPRSDGRLLVGATVEDAGFDERVTAGAIHALLHAALAAAPALGAFTVTETWAGLRPGSPDGRPFIGPTGIDGLILATGHYRNGILLAPETADLIASFVESGDAAPLRAFSPLRMAEGASRIMQA
jgi:glycine oxidase